MRDLDLAMVCDRFGLGLAVTAGFRVAGYYHNEVWRIDTITGAYAVKRLPVERAGQVEVAAGVEQRVRAAGVPVPEPIPEARTGRFAAALDEGAVRVHRWLDGRAPGVADLGPELSAQVGELLAAVHALGATGAATEERAVDPLDDLAAATRTPPGAGTRVVSHGDLHPKNTLLRPDGELALIDWDTAGTYVAEQEAAGMALDWAFQLDGGIDHERFDAAVTAYRAAGGHLPAEPWVFGGWVRGYREFLTGAGRHEATGTQARLDTVARTLGSLVARLA